MLSEFNEGVCIMQEMSDQQVIGDMFWFITSLYLVTIIYCRIIFSLDLGQHLLTDWFLLQSLKILLFFCSFFFIVCYSRESCLTLYFVKIDLRKWSLVNVKVRKVYSFCFCIRIDIETRYMEYQNLTDENALKSENLHLGYYE